MADPKIRVLDNGPLLVEGVTCVEDAEGNTFTVNPEKTSVALCRCGATANRPFCDGAHKRAGFSACDRASG